MALLHDDKGATIRIAVLLHDNFAPQLKFQSKNIVQSTKILYLCTVVQQIKQIKTKNNYEKTKFCNPARHVHIHGGGKSYAHDIEVANADGVTVYYNFTNNQTELGVTYKGSYNTSAAYSGKVVIPESVTYEGNTYSVTSIGESAFWNCSGLTEVTIPNSVTSIGNAAFQYCSSLTEVTIPSSVTSINGNVFNGCSGLAEVTIGNSVTSIGMFAFNDCTSLTEVTIPSSVTRIAMYAFDGCSGLIEVTIGNSVTSIGNGAFRDCSKLTTIYSLNTTPPTLYSSNFFDEQYVTVNVYVPEEALEAYQTADYWKDFQKLQGFDATAIAKVSAAEQIESANGQITVTGLTDGTTVAVYDLSGKQVGTATSKGGQVNISTGMTVGSAAIVKVGERSIKTMMK